MWRWMGKHIIIVIILIIVIAVPRGSPSEALTPATSVLSSGFKWDPLLIRGGNRKSSRPAPMTTLENVTQFIWANFLFWLEEIHNWNLSVCVLLSLVVGGGNGSAVGWLNGLRCSPTERDTQFRHWYSVYIQNGNSNELSGIGVHGGRGGVEWCRGEGVHSRSLGNWLSLLKGKLFTDPSLVMLLLDSHGDGGHGHCILTPPQRPEITLWTAVPSLRNPPAVALPDILCNRKRGQWLEYH